MKVLKTIILGIVFLLGLTAMSPNVGNTETTTSDKAVFEEDSACELFFTACDAKHPKSFKNFDDCMSINGC